MKIYVQSCGWRGSLLVIANNEQEARELMSKEYNYEPESIVEEHDIEHGFMWVDLGDC